MHNVIPPMKRSCKNKHYQLSSYYLLTYCEVQISEPFSYNGILENRNKIVILSRIIRI